MGATNSTRTNIHPDNLKRFQKEIAPRVIEHFKDIELMVVINIDQIRLIIDHVEINDNQIKIYLTNNIATQLTDHLSNRIHDGYIPFTIEESTKFLNLDSIKKIKPTSHGESKNLLKKFMNYSFPLHHYITWYMYEIEYHSSITTDGYYVMDVKL